MKLPTVRLSRANRRILCNPTQRLNESWTKYMTAVKAAGATFDTVHRQQSIPEDRMKELIRALSTAGFEVEVEEALLKHLEKAKARHEEKRAEAKTLHDAAIARMNVIDEDLATRGLALYPYQRDGVRWLSHRKGAGLFDEMGLGKTVQALISAPDGAPILVVAPAAVKGVWRRETRRWRPDLGWPIVLSGRKSFKWPIPGDIIVTNYDILPELTNIGTKEQPRYALPEWLPEPRAGTVLIFDECHMLKNPKAKRTVASRLISQAVRKAGGFAWGLTGTPLLNRPPELWHVLSVLDVAKEAFGTRGNFKALFNPWTNEPDPAVAHRLREVSLMRRRKEVMPDLPTKTYRDVSVPIDADTRKLADELTRKLLDSGIDLTKIQSVAELVASTKNTPITIGEISTVRAALAQAKTGKLLELVEEHEAEEKPVVVFCYHRGPIDAIAKRPGWVKVTGAETGLERTRIVEQFAQGRLKGIACTIRAAGIGIDGLQRASHEVIFVDLDWTPGWNQQSEDRVCRIGQDRGVIITTLIADHLMDRKVIELLSAKTRVIEHSVNASARATVEEQFVDEDPEDRVTVKVAKGPAPDPGDSSAPAFLHLPNLWALTHPIPSSTRTISTGLSTHGRHTCSPRPHVSSSPAAASASCIFSCHSRRRIAGSPRFTACQWDAGIGCERSQFTRRSRPNSR